MRFKITSALVLHRFIKISLRRMFSRSVSGRPLRKPNNFCISPLASERLFKASISLSGKSAEGMGSEFQVMPPSSTAKRRTQNSDDCRALRSASGPENEREPVIHRLFRSKRTRNSVHRKSKHRPRAADSRVKHTSTRTALKPNAVRPFRDEPARRRISPRRSSSRPRPYLPSTRSDNSTPRCAANSVRPP